jgi:hypothetical protein
MDQYNIQVLNPTLQEEILEGVDSALNKEFKKLPREE